jgi:cell division protein FtsZ
LSSLSHAYPTVKVLGIGGTGCTIVELLRSQAVLNGSCTTVTVNRATEPRAADVRVASGIDDDLTLADTGLMLDLVMGTDVVFLVAGLGGGAGTELSRHFATLAKRANAVVVAVLVTPFDFEAPSRRAKARQGVDRIAAIADRVHILENQSLLEQFPNETMEFTNGLAVQAFVREAAHIGALA